MPPTHEQWAEKAQYDLDTAKAMLDSGRYVYVIFCCQQAVEKMLKAIIAKRTDTTPPLIHNLIRLAERCGLDVEQDVMRFFGMLSSLYVQSRYPDEMDDVSGDISSNIAQATLTRTAEVITWLRSKIQ